MRRTYTEHYLDSFKFIQVILSKLQRKICPIFTKRFQEEKNLLEAHFKLVNVTSDLSYFSLVKKFVIRNIIEGSLKTLNKFLQAFS